jgi:Short-chain dehydrogenases of various substrate specificities
VTARIAIILGATGGFGRACVQILVGSGWQVFAVARDADRLDVIRRSIPNVQTVQLDLGASGAVLKLSKVAPRADLIVHAAAETRFAPFCDLDAKSIAEDLSLNLTSLVVILEHYLPSMMVNRSGAVLTMSSTAALRAAPGIALYAAAKSFAFSLTRSLAEELRSEGITLTCCVAGPMDTGFAERIGYPRSGQGASPHYVAKRALEACLSGKTIVYSDWNAMMRAFLYRSLPDWLVRSLWRRRARVA